MASYGRQVLSTTVGNNLSVLANLDHVQWKAGGVTIDWATVTAAAADTTWNDGTQVVTGRKYLRYGTVITRITATGKYGPYDSGAADGRQTLTPGQCYILAHTDVELNVLPGLPVPPSDHPGVFDAGLVWYDRLLLGGAGQPTVVNFGTAFPRVSYAQT